MSCYPLIELSICDNDVLVANSSDDAVLHVRKGVKTICSYDILTTSGHLKLTDVEILDFGSINGVYTLQMKNSANEIIPFEYTDCTGTPQVADAIRVRFNDCVNINSELNEVCF